MVDMGHRTYGSEIAVGDVSVGWVNYIQPLFFALGYGRWPMSRLRPYRFGVEIRGPPEFLYLYYKVPAFSDRVVYCSVQQLFDAGVLGCVECLQKLAETLDAGKGIVIGCGAINS